VTCAAIYPSHDEIISPDINRMSTTLVGPV
jgi:hypothetical protein